MIKVELVKGTVFELDPTKNYLLCFDKKSISIGDLRLLSKQLKFGNGSIAVMIDGDPNTAVKIVEAKS